MKEIFRYISAVIFVLAFAACSEIAEDERFVEMPLPDVNRNVLIEDFTGQSCVNCPDATDIIHELQEQYGSDVVVAVGIYSGPFGKTPSTQLNLQTETGKGYWNHWFTSSTPQPIGMVNRQPAQEKEEWKQTVAEQLAKPTKMELSFSSQYAADSREVTITVSVCDPTLDKGTLQVWLTEDNIVAYQKRGTEKLLDYVHNHVFRAAVNGDWGEEIVLGSQQPTQRTYTCTLDENWKPEDMHAVAFVTTDDGVEQVATGAIQ